VFRLMAPRLLGVAVVQLNFIANTIIALGQPEGSVSAIALAFSLMLMPQMAVAQSAAIASLPTFSAQVALGREDEMRKSLASTLRMIIMLSLPAAVGLILLRYPLIQLLYQRGEFTARSTEMVSWALLWYAVGLVGHGLVEILSRAFYALHDTRTPVTVGVVTMGLNIGLSLAFSAWFTRLGWMPHGGLALANSVATGLESAVLLVLIRRKLNGLEGAFVWRGLAVSAVGSALMVPAVMSTCSLLASRGLVILLAGALGVGVVVYFGLLWVLKTPELMVLIAMVRGKIKRPRS